MSGTEHKQMVEKITRGLEIAERHKNTSAEPS